MLIQAINGNNNTNFTGIDKVKRFGSFKKDKSLADAIIDKMKSTEEVNNFCEKHNVKVRLGEYPFSNRREAAMRIMYKEKPTQNKLKDFFSTLRYMVAPKQIYTTAHGRTTEEAVENLGKRITEEQNTVRTYIWCEENGYKDLTRNL